MRSRFLLAASLIVALVLAASAPSPAEEAPSKEKINKLIEQLGSGNFKEREDASKELAAIGVPALEALRKAAKGGDAEVRKRAEELLPKIEVQAESLRVLAPKRVHLIFKDTPVPEAVADLQKKSGYTIYLHDPQGKLKERKITLDTGETSFWHAVALLCDKAELTEGNMQDLLMQPPQMPGGAPIPPPPPAKNPAADGKAPPAAAAKPVPAAPAPPPAVAQPPKADAERIKRMQMQQQRMQMQMQMQAGNNVNVRMGQVIMPGMKGKFGQLLLKDGKAKKLPADDRSAVRIRAQGKSDLFGNAPKGEVILALELSLEPKLQWQTFQSVRLEGAVDDQDQKLTQVVPQVQGPGALGGAALPPGRARPIGQGYITIYGIGGLHQPVPVQFKKGAKEAKALKELNGTITVQMLTESRPLIAADKLDKSSGKTFKGKEGGSIKIVEVKTDEENKTTIQFEFEQTPNSIPAFAQMGFPAMPAPVAAPAPVKGGAAAPPANPVAPPRGKPPMTVGPLIGLSVQDDKGNALPIEMRQQQFRIQQVPGGGKAAVPTAVWTLVCEPGKDQGQPAKLVYLGRKRATVEIPFALKDVPLP